MRTSTLMFLWGYWVRAESLGGMISSFHEQDKDCKPWNEDKPTRSDRDDSQIWDQGSESSIFPPRSLQVEVAEKLRHNGYRPEATKMQPT